MTNLTQDQKIEIIVANNGPDAGTAAIRHMVRCIEEDILEYGLRSHPVKIAQNIAAIVGKEIQAEVPAHVIEFGVSLARSRNQQVNAHVILDIAIDNSNTLQTHCDDFDLNMRRMVEDYGTFIDPKAPLEERSRNILDAAAFTRSEGKELYERAVEYLEASARYKLDRQAAGAVLFDLIIDVEYEKMELPPTHMNASPRLSYR